MTQAKLLKGAWGLVLLCLCISSRVVKNAFAKLRIKSPNTNISFSLQTPKTPPPPIHFSSLNQYYTTIISLQNY